MRACKANPLLCTWGLNTGWTDSHACHSGVPDFSELRVYSRTPLGLVNLGFHFGRVVMRFLELACVRARVTPCFAFVPHGAVALTLTHIKFWYYLELGALQFEIFQKKNKQKEFFSIVWTLKIAIWSFL